MSGRVFRTQGDVLNFLHELGLKISRAKLSKDYRAGILRCQPDKTFIESDISAYAESLKAPAFCKDKVTENLCNKQLHKLKKLILDLCSAIPEMEATKSVLEKWLAKDEIDPGITDKLEACQRRITRQQRAASAKDKTDNTEQPTPTKKETANNEVLTGHDIYRMRKTTPDPENAIQPDIPDGYDKITDFDPHARFCLTGIFAYGERGDCERLVKLLGGKVAKRPVLYEQCYVVVGSASPASWMSNKIRLGLRYREQGGSVKFLTEDDWINMTIEYEKKTG